MSATTHTSPVGARDRARSVVRILFVAAMAVFVLIGATLVAVQAVGVVLVQPALVSGASDALLVPAIGAAIVFGLIAFGGGYLEDRPSSGDASTGD
ncbi:hypothetical protein [Pseudonocardia sp. ICBG1293]|uniref:hypothetical protein n=1 Tax=Pseudonocardia sp. ICBG1293 TaxID=2844382 RepID=UPI001CCAB527|nr:hypothetical protein [Pseudonocardia sp. ICBG1293]